MGPDSPIAVVDSPAPKIYFGWRIVAAMQLTTAIVYGTLFFSFIILGAPLAEQFGWNSAETGSLVSAMWIVAPLALFVAPIIQRFGAFRVIMIGLGVQAATFACLGFVESFWQLYLLRIIMGVGKVVTVVAVPVMITAWFEKRFSTAMALAWCGGSVGGFVLAPTTEHLLSFMTWQQTTLALAALMVVAMGAIALLCRGAKEPAELGLGLDGTPGLSPEAKHSENPAEKATIGDLKAINKSTAITMLVALMLAGMGGIAMQNQTPAAVFSAGLSMQIAATLLGLVSVFSTIGQAGIGWLLDRWSVERCTLLVAFALIGGLSSFTMMNQMWAPALATIGAILFGLGLGATEMMWVVLTKVQFGTRLFAWTYGGWSFAVAAGYAAGGPVGGWLFDHFPHQWFPLFVLALYVPATIAAVLRPGKRNRA